MVARRIPHKLRVQERVYVETTGCRKQHVSCSGKVWCRVNKVETSVSQEAMWKARPGRRKCVRLHVLRSKFGGKQMRFCEQLKQGLCEELAQLQKLH